MLRRQDGPRTLTHNHQYLCVCCQYLLTTKATQLSTSHIDIIMQSSCNIFVTSIIIWCLAKSRSVTPLKTRQSFPMDVCVSTDMRCDRINFHHNAHKWYSAHWILINGILICVRLSSHVNIDHTHTNVHHNNNNSRSVSILHTNHYQLNCHFLLCAEY